MKRTLRPLGFERCEARQLFAASVGWDGPGLGGAELTYYVGNVPSGFSLSQSEVETAIDTALKAWASVADIDFTKATTPGQARSIDISFARIDGVGGTLAQAYLPADLNSGAKAGDVQFDTSDAYEVGNAKGNSAFDFLWVAVHEIGHALGLEHTESVGSVLAPSVSPSQAFVALDQASISGIQKLYRSAPGSVNSEAPTTPPATHGSGTDSGSNTSNPTSGQPRSQPNCFRPTDTSSTGSRTYSWTGTPTSGTTSSSEQPWGIANRWSMARWFVARSAVYDSLRSIRWNLFSRG